MSVLNWVLLSHTHKYSKPVSTSIDKQKQAEAEP